MTYAHAETIRAVGQPGAKFPDVAAALASPMMTRVGALMRRSGLDGMTAPISAHELESKLAAMREPMPSADRLALKISLERVGLLKN